MTWVSEEFSEVSLGDERLDRRFQDLVERLVENAGQSIQLACEDWAGTKAAYRFFDNPKVDKDEIIGSHFSATIRRAEAVLSDEEVGFLLVIQDTTFLNYSHHPKTTGLGEISKYSSPKDKQKLKASGFILHSSLALTTTGVPLGFLDQKLWTRTKPIGLITKSRKNMTRIPIEEKESFRWIESIRNVSGRIDPQRIIHVGDREADIFELFSEAARARTHFVVRLRDKQRHIEPGIEIFDPIETTPTKGRFRIHVQNKDGKSRIAKVEVKFFRVRVLPSVAKKHLEPVSASVVSAIETNPPDGEEPIDWKLITDFEVESFKAALEKINWYKMRWQIEVYHKVLKTGCQVLQCRLRTAERLIRYIAVMTVAAWRIFWMTLVSRNAPDLEPSAVITPDEMKAIRLYSSKKNRRIPATAACNQWVREIARLGGFLARKSDGNPGPLVLWRGYLRLQDIMLGISLAPN